MSNNNRYCVIMCGGVGSRFWPYSRASRPKQFLDFFGTGRSLLQMSVDRMAGIVPDENIILMTNEQYADIIREQLPQIAPSQILLEPARRNTAPCIAWAAHHIAALNPDARIMVAPSDHLIMKTEEFRTSVLKAFDFIDRHDAILTLGIKPNRPETGYGYVETQSVASPAGSEILKVASFKEKPDLETAEKYLKAGNYLWNAGIFVWNVKTITEAIKTYKPNIASDMERMKTDADVQEVFPQCEKISIDYAVMEPAAADGRVYTHPADFGWSDLGNWASLHDKLQKDNENNGAVGKVHLYECRNCVVHAEEADQLEGRLARVLSAR